MPYICQKCWETFGSRELVRAHVHDKHRPKGNKGERRTPYGRASFKSNLKEAYKYEP